MPKYREIFFSKISAFHVEELLLLSTTTVGEWKRQAQAVGKSKRKGREDWKELERLVCLCIHEFCLKCADWTA